MAKAGTVSELTGLGGEVDTEGGDSILCWVPVELTDQEVIVLHPKRELLHILGVGEKWFVRGAWPAPPL